MSIIIRIRQIFSKKFIVKNSKFVFPIRLLTGGGVKSNPNGALAPPLLISHVSQRVFGDDGDRRFLVLRGSVRLRRSNDNSSRYRRTLRPV